MLNTVHVVAAAAIVAAIPDPRISLPLSLVSHIALDTVPHWNWSPGRSLVGKMASINDGLVAVVALLALSIYMGFSGIVIAAGLLAMMPDIIQAPYHFLGWRPIWLSRFIEWERQRQKWPWMKPWMGVATQVFTLLVSLLIIFT